MLFYGPSDLNCLEVLFLKARNHLFPLLLLLLGLVASVWVLLPRIEAEEEHHTYDIVLDYSSLEEMAEESEQSVEFWLRHFSSLGVDKLALTELTPETLAQAYPGEIYLDTAGQIVSRYGWQQDYPVQISSLLASGEGEDAVIVCSDFALAQWLQEQLEQRYAPSMTRVETADGEVMLYLTGTDDGVTGEEMLSAPLGLDPQVVELAKDCGYTVIPRSTPLEGANTAQYARDYLNSHQEQGSPYLICTGSQFPGLEEPEAADAAILEHLEQTGATLAVVETSQQSMNLVNDTLTELVEISGDNAVRVFSMWDYIQWRYQWYGYEGSEEIVNCLYRAVYERNCRVIFLKMMMKQLPDSSTEYVTEPEAYTTLLESFSQRMSDLGYQWQTVGSMGRLEVHPLALTLLALGAVAGAALLLDRIFPLPRRKLWLLTGLMGLCAAAVLRFMPNTGRLILSIGGGIVMPLLAMLLLTDWCAGNGKKPTLAISCVLAAALTGLTALVGGLFACAPLSDSGYMLEMELYRGVKFMQLVPLAGLIAYYLLGLLRQQRKRLLAESAQQRQQMVQTLLDTPIRVRHLLYALAGLVLAGVLAAVGVYYLARTGHSTGAGASDLELLMRNVLEQQLPARPRTKEFLIGYPCIMLFVWCWRRGLKWASLLPGLGAVIGLTSVVNTFLHIRTTFLLSLTRVGIGFGMGLVLGLVAVAAAELIFRTIKKRNAHV